MASKNIQNEKQTLLRHTVIGRILHWVTGGFVIYGYVKGLRNVSQLADPELWLFEVLFALFLGVILTFRYYWMNNYNKGVTRIPESTNPFQKKMVWLGHNAMYFGLAAIIVTGLLIAGIVKSPFSGSILEDAVVFLHNASVGITEAVIIGHVVVALFHKYWLKDGIMETMTSLKK